MLFLYSSQLSDISEAWSGLQNSDGWERRGREGGQGRVGNVEAGFSLNVKEDEFKNTFAPFSLQT